MSERNSSPRRTRFPVPSWFLLPAWAVAAAVLLAVLMAAPPALAQQQGAQSQAVQAARYAFRGPDLGGKDGPLAKIGMDLARLYYEAQRVGAATQGAGAAAEQTLLPVQDGHVRIDAVAVGNAPALRARLDALGLRRGAVAGPVVSGWLPIAALVEAAQLGTLRFARPSLAKVQRVMRLPRRQEAQPVVSQGVRAMNAADARDQFGVNGSGVTVGVLSDSFDCLGEAADDVEAGEIPPDVLLTEEPDCESGTDEGRAMVQLIFDVAPGADQRFNTAFGGIASFANNVRDLADEGAGVIVDDVIYFAEPMFAEGQIAQAVNEVFDRGVAYFSSAGNANGQSYESDDGFRDSGQEGPLEGGSLHDFDPAAGTIDRYQGVTLPEGATVTISLQWDEPYPSAGSSEGASNDFDLVLVDSNGDVVASATFDNIGNDPIEVLQYENDGSTDANGDGTPDTQFRLGIELVEGDASDVNILKYVYTSDPNDEGQGFALREYAAPHSTLYGHANARGAEAVGAAPYFNTPAFNSVVTVEDGRIVVLGDEGPGDTDSIIESFSALGGTPILFDASGNRISETRRKPEIVAPDGTNNTFFGSDLGPDFDDIGDDDPFPNFFGTSAAAPHAAGVAALMRSLNSDLAPASLYGILEDTAIDMDNPRTSGFDAGFDFKTGFGFVNALAALEQVPNKLNLAANLVTVEGEQQVELTVTTEEPDAAERFVILRCFGTRAECGTGGGGFEPVETIDATGESAFTVTASVNNPGTYTFLVRQVNSDGTERVRTVQVTVRLAEGETFVLTEAFPNPFQNRAQLRLIVERGETVDVTATLYDALGRRVRTFFEGEVESQEMIPLEAGSLSSGVYFIRVESEDFVETRSVVLVR